MAAPQEYIGRYCLLNLKQTSNFTQVWEVVENSSRRHFAMKIMLPEHVNNHEERKLLFHDARVLQKLAHENIVKVHEIVDKGCDAYFTMEYFPAGSLRQRLIDKENDFILDHAQGIFRETMAALASVHHAKFVHRDIKPDNILVSAAGDVRLIDFAVACKMGESRGFFGRLFGGKPPVIGTRSYMSPEQINSEPLDARADIYSMGCTMYELLTGRPPFRGTSEQNLLSKHLFEAPVPATTHNKDITDDFSKLILRMIAKKKEDRPKSFHEILLQLKKMRILKSRPMKPAAPKA